MVSVQLDRVRNFKYGMRGISFIEKKLNKPIGKVNFENLTMEETAIVIQAGLIHEDKEIGLKTADEIMEMIDSNENMEEVLEAMGKAMEDMFSKGKTEKN